jgi:uncharacterized membrane protein YuzA (DUF378 family)
MMGHSRSLHMVTFTLLVVGGINWGLAIWGWDIASWGLGDTLVKIIYGLVALSALYEVFTHGGRCRACNPAGGMGGGMGGGMNKPAGM